MQQQGTGSDYGLEKHGIINYQTAYWNLSPAELIEKAVCRKEGRLTNKGALAVETGLHTGRTPHDKYFVQSGEEDKYIFWSKDNKPITPQDFEKLHQKALAYLQNRDIFIQDLIVGAHPDHQLPIRIISELAWANLLSQNLFILPEKNTLQHHIPEFTVLHCPFLQASPVYDNINSNTFVVINMTAKLVLIGNTGYGGEIKKSIFSILNYIQPLKGNMSMHCSANVGKDGDTALFFGLSGTGKTTLSSDEDRYLIGDDEHGWTEDGIFNFEGGCYAKTINLNPKYEPAIHKAAQHFGTVLENVVLNSNRDPDFDDNRLTENTRAAYPIDFIKNHLPEGHAGHPQNIFFLTADAFGVLPPISRLTKNQAIYYFLSGYTSKLAGTEVGLGKEPLATFSMCFGAPFMPLHPKVYAELLGKKIEKYNVDVWLINTGWTGGPYGVGKRFSLPHTRAMVKAALNKKLENVRFYKDDYFNLQIPESCPDVPQEILNPQTTWQDKTAYKKQAIQLIARFTENFDQFVEIVSEDVFHAGPHINN